MAKLWGTFAAAATVLLCASANAQTDSWKTHMELGRQAREARRFNEAEKQFKAAADDAKRTPGKELLQAESLDALAVAYRDQNKYAKGEAAYKQSLSIRELILGPWHPKLAETLDNLAGMLSSEDKQDQALPLYKRAREIREQAMVEHPDVYVDGVRVPVTEPKKSAVSEPPDR